MRKNTGFMKKKWTSMKRCQTIIGIREEATPYMKLVSCFDFPEVEEKPKKRPAFQRSMTVFNLLSEKSEGAATPTPSEPKAPEKPSKLWFKPMAT
jgi:hypothetical protein